MGCLRGRGPRLPNVGRQNPATGLLFLSIRPNRPVINIAGRPDNRGGYVWSCDQALQIRAGCRDPDRTRAIPRRPLEKPATVHGHVMVPDKHHWATVRVL